MFFCLFCKFVSLSEIPPTPFNKPLDLWKGFLLGPADPGASMNPPSCSDGQCEKKEKRRNGNYN